MASLKAKLISHAISLRKVKEHLWVVVLSKKPRLTIGSIYATLNSMVTVLLSTLLSLDMQLVMPKAS